MVNYTGETENGNIPHGFGTGVFLDESEPYTYMGHWKHGLASGFGQIVYANGDVYIGKKIKIVFKKTFDFARKFFRGFLANYCRQYNSLAKNLSFKIQRLTKYIIR